MNPSASIAFHLDRKLFFLCFVLSHFTSGVHKCSRNEEVRISFMSVRLFVLEFVIPRFLYFHSCVPGGVTCALVFLGIIVS